jgi:hypothetical protein
MYDRVLIQQSHGLPERPMHQYLRGVIRGAVQTHLNECYEMQAEERRSALEAEQRRLERKDEEAQGNMPPLSPDEKQALREGGPAIPVVKAYCNRTGRSLSDGVTAVRKWRRPHEGEG